MQIMLLKPLQKLRNLVYVNSKFSVWFLTTLLKDHIKYMQIIYCNPIIRSPADGVIVEFYMSKDFQRFTSVIGSFIFQPI